MVEYEGVFVEGLRAGDEGLATLNTFDSTSNAIYTSPDLWQPQPYGGMKLVTSLTAERFGFAAFPKFVGSPNLVVGCYRDVDRLALLAFVRKLDGTPLPFADVLFKGNIYKEIGKTNEHGIVGAYLLPDNYSNTTIISRNGIVYEQADLKEMLKGVYEITVRRITKANAPFRQLHRRFD